MEDKKGNHYVGLGIIPPEEIEMEVRKVQQFLNQNYEIYLSRQPPHVTIKSPYYVEDLNEHVNYLESLVRQMESLYLSVSGINHFNNQVIYLEVEKNDRLNDFHHFLLENIVHRSNIAPDPLEGSNWVPHMSIASIEDQSLCNKILLELNEKHLRFHWKVESVGLFINDEDKGWQVEKVFKI